MLEESEVEGNLSKNLLYWNRMNAEEKKLLQETKERIEKLEKSPSNGKDFDLVKEVVIRSVEEYGEALKKLAQDD